MDKRKMPRSTPSAVARAALRPCSKAFFVTSAMSTPGVITTTAETSKNGSTCTAGSSHRDDDLASRVAFADVAQRLRRVAQLVLVLDDRSDLSGLDHVFQDDQVLTRDVGKERCGDGTVARDREESPAD